MSELRQAFLDGMSSVATTVNVVATDGPGGRAGVTVSAMSSVSADTEKPVLLVCVNDLSAGAAPIITNGAFTVNILRDDQSFVSDTFAGRYGDKGEEKFACAEWDRGVTGAPILRGALASFDCRLVKDEIVGQHHVFFGEVQQVHLAERGRALIYANRSYSTALSLLPAGGAAASAGAERIAIACLSSFAPLYLPALLRRFHDEVPDIHIDVIEGDQAQCAHLVETGEVELALVYDRDLPSLLACERIAVKWPHAVLPIEHALAGRVSVTLAELVAEPLILLDQALSRDYVHELFSSHELVPNVVMRSPSFELVRSLVGNGLGYSILVTEPASDQTYDGNRVSTKPIADAALPISICVVHHPKNQLSAPARELVALFRKLQP